MDSQKIKDMIEQLREKKAAQREALMNLKFNLYLLQKNIDKFQIDLEKTKHEFYNKVGHPQEEKDVFGLADNKLKSTGS